MEKIIVKVEFWEGVRYGYYKGDYIIAHREDGPAIIHKNGDKFWFIDGKRHREDGPAVEHNNGDKEWFFDGQRHREDGPAVHWSNGYKEWFLEGKRTENFEKALKIYKVSKICK
jgi:hypothetical protein